MWNRTIRDMVRRGGGTLWPCGCCEFAPDYGAQVAVPNTGGAVALDDEDAFEAVFTACEKWIESQPSQHDYYIGLWVDDGMLWVEVSEHFVELADAEIVGRCRAQKCIWDWKSGLAVSTME
jgi:hypothetical protein